MLMISSKTQCEYCLANLTPDLQIGVLDKSEMYKIKSSDKYTPCCFCNSF